MTRRPASWASSEPEIPLNGPVHYQLNKHQAEVVNVNNMLKVEYKDMLRCVH